MYQKVVAYVGRCEVCDWVRSSFNTLSPRLQPLLNYGTRLPLVTDFAGPWVVTPCKVKYMLVMVEILASGLNLSLYPKTL